jgi:hypothetical protein
MAQYLVTWKIDIEDDSPEEAARQALEIMQDKTSEALTFTVKKWSTGEETYVNLLDERLDKIERIQQIIKEYGNFSTCDVDADSSPYIAGAGHIISLAEDFYEDKVTVYNYNKYGNEESSYDLNYYDLSNEVIDKILEMAEIFVNIQELELDE